MFFMFIMSNILIFFCFMFLVFMIKSQSLMLMILNIEYFSIILIFSTLLTNNSMNILFMSIILLIMLSIESIILLSIYINLMHFNSKDYIFIYKVM